MQQSPADQLAALPDAERAAFLASLSEQEAASLLHDWRGFLARPDQIAPPGDWDVWLCLAGRGWGKTRTGSEWIREEVTSGRAKRIALIAETAADARDVMVEGESGILACHPDDERPVYEPSKRRVTWPNGAVATLFNATEPDQLRGPQFDLAWCDELAKWRYARETWDMLQFGLRLGDHPRALVTTTPRPIEIVKAILAGQEGKVAVTRGATFDNATNLAATFLERIKRRYEGTRLGRQELNGEVLGDLPGALWPQSTLDAYRQSVMPARNTLRRVVVAIDPAVTNTEDSDEHGVVVAALTEEGEGLVLADETMKGSPHAWAQKVVSLYRTHEADAIVAEVNQGGDMVAQIIRSIAPNANVKQVRATKGKHIRAEPIAALYEQGRIRHVGQFHELEAQMAQMTTAGYQGEGSPDRLDALVWALSELFPDIAEPLNSAGKRVVPPAFGGGSWLGA